MAGSFYAGNYCTYKQPIGNPNLLSATLNRSVLYFYVKDNGVQFSAKNALS